MDALPSGPSRGVGSFPYLLPKHRTKGYDFS